MLCHGPRHTLFAFFQPSPILGTLKQISEKGGPLDFPNLLTAHGKPGLKGSILERRPQIRGYGVSRQCRKLIWKSSKGPAVGNKKPSIL